MAFSVRRLFAPEVLWQLDLEDVAGLDGLSFDASFASREDLRSWVRCKPGQDELSE